MGKFQHRVAALAGCRTNESMGVVKVINYLRMCQRSFACCHCVFQVICFSLSSSLLTKTGIILENSLAKKKTNTHFVLSSMI